MSDQPSKSESHPGNEATERDLKRLDLIDAELRKVASDLISAAYGMRNTEGNT